MLACGESNTAVSLNKPAPRMDCRVSPAMTREKSFSRHVLVPEPCRPPSQIDSPPAKEGGEAPKGAMPTIAAQASTNVAACRCLEHGCAPLSEARPPSGASTAALAGTPIPAQLQAMLPATRNQAGVTRPIRSQFSDSTSRLGRSTEGNDAQSRPGAGCKPARRHRTRSASESALAKASLDERDDVTYLIQ
jgi:hypothetical protein